MFASRWKMIIFSLIVIIIAYYWGKSIDNTLIPDYVYPASSKWCDKKVQINDSYIIDMFNTKYNAGQQYFFYVYDHEKKLMLDCYEKVKNNYDNGVYDPPRFIRSPIVIIDIDQFLYGDSDIWIGMLGYKITNTGVRNIIRETNNTKLFDKMCGSFDYFDLTKYEMAFLYHYLDNQMEIMKDNSIFDTIVYKINCWFSKSIKDPNVFSKCEMDQLLFDTKNNNWFDTLMSRRKMYEIYNIFPTNDLPHIPVDIWYSFNES